MTHRRTSPIMNPTTETQNRHETEIPPPQTTTDKKLFIKFKYENTAVDVLAVLSPPAAAIMDFINDAIVSMNALVSAYKHAAVYFSCPVLTSCKLSGSVAAANYKETSIVNQAQKEQIHRPGRGDRFPLGAGHKRLC
ncbi:hypothetical protein Tco_1439235 [Tanacetum coccineum]